MKVSEAIIIVRMAVTTGNNPPQREHSHRIFLAQLLYKSTETVRKSINHNWKARKRLSSFIGTAWHVFGHAHYKAQCPILSPRPYPQLFYEHSKLVDKNVCSSITWTPWTPTRRAWHCVNNLVIYELISEPVSTCDAIRHVVLDKINIKLLIIDIPHELKFRIINSMCVCACVWVHVCVSACVCVHLCECMCVSACVC